MAKQAKTLPADQISDAVNAVANGLPEQKQATEFSGLSFPKTLTVAGLLRSDPDQEISTEKWTTDFLVMLVLKGFQSYMASATLGITKSAVNREVKILQAKKAMLDRLCRGEIIDETKSSSPEELGEIAWLNSLGVKIESKPISIRNLLLALQWQCRQAILAKQPRIEDEALAEMLTDRFDDWRVFIRENNPALKALIKAERAKAGQIEETDVTFDF